MIEQGTYFQGFSVTNANKKAVYCTCSVSTGYIESYLLEFVKIQNQHIIHVDAHKILYLEITINKILQDIKLVNPIDNVRCFNH